jgi:hypothetical protein
MKYLDCPVCGLDKLPKPLEEFDICPCCGTEFGYDDLSMNHAQLRLRWINAGANWWSETTLPPAMWSPITQLTKAELLPCSISNENETTEESITFVNWGYYLPPIARIA